MTLHIIPLGLSFRHLLKSILSSLFYSIFCEGLGAVISSSTGIQFSQIKKK